MRSARRPALRSARPSIRRGRLCSLALLGLSVISLPSLAERPGRYGPAEISDDYVEFLGFSADENSYAYSKSIAVWLGPDSGHIAESATVAIVRSLHTGAILREFLLDQTFLLPADCSKAKCGSEPAADEAAVAPQAVAMRRRLWALPRKADFAAWRAQNPLSCRAPRSPHGGQELSAIAEPKRAEVHSHGRRTFLGFFFRGAGDPAHPEVPEQITLRLLGPTAGESGPASAVIRNLRAEGSLEGRVTVCISGGARRIAWLVERFESNKRDFGEQFFHIGPGEGPRIQLLGRRDTLTAAAVQLDGQLKTLQLSLLSARPAPTRVPDAPASLQVRKGQEAAAQRVAALFPGTPISELDPKSSYDIVIAPGPESPARPAGLPLPAPAPAPLGGR